MATSTTNYGLRKPATTDNVNVQLDLNGNYDIIDATMKDISDDVVQNAEDIATNTGDISSINTTLTNTTGSVTAGQVTLGSLPTYYRVAGIGIIHFSNSVSETKTLARTDPVVTISPAPNAIQHFVVAVGTNTITMWVNTNGNVCFNSTTTLTSGQYIIGQGVFFL